MGKHSFISASDLAAVVGSDAANALSAGRSARYIGRVGVLAVALGVGVAVATMPGIAGATTGSESDTNTSTNDNEPDDAVGGGDDITSRGGDVEPVGEENTEDDETEDGETEEDDAEEPEDGDDEGDGIDDDGLDDGVIDGGADVVVADPPMEPSNDPAASDPLVVAGDPYVPEVIVDPASAERPGKQTQDLSNPSGLAPDTSPNVVVDPAPQNVVTEPSPELLIFVEDDDADASTLSTGTADSLRSQSFSSSVVQQPAPAPFSFISTVVSALVVPLLSPIGPISPAQTPVLFAVLAWVRRQVEHTFANQAPVLVDNQDTELVDEDTVTGTVTGTDADPEDTVSYSYTGGAPGADISVDENGTWTYSAPESWDGTTEYTDSFTITATDESESPFHLHGFVSIFAPDRGHTASQVITVTIPASDANSAPEVQVSDPSESDPETGAVTFTVTARDADDDPLTVTASDGSQVSAPVYDAASDSYVYTVTYTPDPQDRLDAYSSAGEDVVPVTVLVDDGVNDPVSETVSVTIDPVAAVVAPGATSTVPAGAVVTGATTGADGTVATTTFGGSWTTMTVLRPGSSTPQVASIQGFPVGAPQVGEDGTVAVATRTGSGTQADPYETTVVVFRPGSSAPDAVIAPGELAAPPQVGADGTVAIKTRSGSGTAEDPTVTRVTVLRPGATTPIVHTFDGTSSSNPVVGADGTVAITKRTGSGEVGDLYKATVMVLRPGESAFDSTELTGLPFGLGVGADGTVVQQIVSPSGLGATSDSQITVAVWRAGAASPETTLVEGNPLPTAPTVGPDGTVAVTTYTQPAVPGDPVVTTVTVLRPDDSIPQTVTVDGFPNGAPQMGADGTVAQATNLGSEANVVVLRPGEETPIVNTVPGNGVVRVGADGTVAHTSTTGDGSASNPTVTRVTVLRPGDPTPDTATVTGAGYVNQGAQIGANGTVAHTTQTGDGTVADPYITTVTVLRPGDAPVSATFVGNPGSRAPQVGSDGTVVLTTTGGAADTNRTTVTMLRPGDDEPVSQSVDGTPILNAPPVLNDDGTVTLSTMRGSGTAADPIVITQYTITFADAPTSVV